jgi:hypothetical protein
VLNFGFGAFSPATQRVFVFNINLNPSFLQIEQLVGTTYSAEWRRIFPQDRGLIPANLYVSSEVSGGAFSISRNEIRLKIGNVFSSNDLNVERLGCFGA